MTETTRITKLTRDNVRAIEEAVIPAYPGLVTVGKTYAVFNTDAKDAFHKVDAATSGFPRRGHPVASLHAVLRKLQAEIAVQSREAQLDPLARQILHEDRPRVKTDAELEAEDSSPRIVRFDDAPMPELLVVPTSPLDPAALFLLGWDYVNLFDQVDSSPRGRTGDFRCKACGEIVAFNQRRPHHAADKARAGDAIAAHAADRRANMAAKQTTKKTARDQGVPEVYLGENGNYRPGMDARHKSDLIAAILGRDQSKALTKPTPEEALAMIKARGWQVFLDKSKAADDAAYARKTAKAEEAKQKAADKQKAAAEKKAAAAKKKAESKKAETADSAPADSTDEVTPDPKPTPKPKASRGRKVAA